jgi:hypothetical protein
MKLPLTKSYRAVLTLEFQWLSSVLTTATCGRATLAVCRNWEVDSGCYLPEVMLLVQVFRTPPPQWGSGEWRHTGMLLIRVMTRPQCLALSYLTISILILQAYHNECFYTLSLQAQNAVISSASNTPSPDDQLAKISTGSFRAPSPGLP